MTKGIFSTIKKYNLNHADNPYLIQLRENNWQYRLSTKNKDHLFDDAVSGLVNFSDRPFNSSFEFREFSKIYVNSDQEETGKTKKLGEHLTKLFFGATPAQKVEKECYQLKKAWKSGIPTLFREAILFSLKNQGYQLEAFPEAWISYENKKWRVKTRLSDISLVDSEQKCNDIPGTFTAYFVLHDVFFTFENYKTDNGLLEALCLRKQVIITPELLAAQLRDYELQEAIDDLAFHIGLCKNNRQLPAQAILNEIKRLKRIYKNQTFHDEMKEVLIAATKLIQDTSSHPDLTEWMTLIKRIEKKSWGEVLAGAMLCLAGIMLNIVSGALLSTSLGIAIPLGIPSIIAGISLMIGGGFLLFKSAEKKPLSKKMDMFMQAVKDPTLEIGMMRI